MTIKRAAALCQAIMTQGTIGKKHGGILGQWVDERK
jgi:hypothetical protein